MALPKLGTSWLQMTTPVSLCIFVCCIKLGMFDIKKWLCQKGVKAASDIQTDSSWYVTRTVLVCSVSCSNFLLFGLSFGLVAFLFLLLSLSLLVTFNFMVSYCSLALDSLSSFFLSFSLSHFTFCHFFSFLSRKALHSL